MEKLNFKKPYSIQFDAIYIYKMISLITLSSLNIYFSLKKCNRYICYSVSIMDYYELIVR